jgi:hypothetical protein
VVGRTARISLLFLFFFVLIREVRIIGMGSATILHGSDRARDLLRIARAGLQLTV